MKQLIPIFIFLLPCLAWAQYPSNGNQKITLGEQSTADGLVFRGVANDTNIITPLSDTSAYIILDTINSKFYHYNRTTTFWSLAGGGVASVSRITFTGSGSGFTSTVTDSTTNPKITINVPSATSLTSGVVTTSGQTFKGTKTFSDGIFTGGLGLFGPQFSSDGYDRMLGSLDGSVGFVRITDGLTLEGDSLKNGLVLTTSGSSGAATFNGTTLNIPNYIPSGIPRPTGTVEAIYSGTGINISPAPLTISGTINADTNFLVTRYDTSAMLSPYWKNGTFSGTLPIVNGGTGSATQNFVDLTNTQTVGGAKTFTSNALLLQGSSFPVITAKATATFPIFSLVNDAQSAQWNIELGRTTSGNLEFYKLGTKVFFTPTGTASFSGLAGTGNRAVLADANGTLSASSSISIKENVENINYGLSDILKLKPVSFNYIDKEKWGEGKDLGFVAEDVMNIIPESTGVMNTSDIYHDMSKLIPVLTKAIQEQQAQIEALKQRLLILENK